MFITLIERATYNAFSTPTPLNPIIAHLVQATIFLYSAFELFSWQDTPPKKIFWKMPFVRNQLISFVQFGFEIF